VNALIASSTPKLQRFRNPSVPSNLFQWLSGSMAQWFNGSVVQGFSGSMIHFDKQGDILYNLRLSDSNPPLGRVSHERVFY